MICACIYDDAKTAIIAEAEKSQVPLNELQQQKFVLE